MLRNKPIHRPGTTPLGFLECAAMIIVGNGGRTAFTKEKLGSGNRDGYSRNYCIRVITIDTNCIAKLIELLNILKCRSSTVVSSVNSQTKCHARWKYSQIIFLLKDSCLLFNFPLLRSRELL
mgnify:CR=1 FL=1